MSAWKVTAITITIIILGGIVKAHMHFIRLALLAILGLLGMYLLHKLAQDWNKIRGGGGGGGNRPRLTSLLGMAGRLFRSKRSMDPHALIDTSDKFEEMISAKFANILYFDPVGCARKFICFSASKPASNLTRSENNLLQMLSRTDHSKSPKDHRAFKIFQDAVELGRGSRNVTMCEQAYKSCYLTNKQLHTVYGYL